MECVRHGTSTTYDVCVWCVWGGGCSGGTCSVQSDYKVHSVFRLHFKMYTYSKVAIHSLAIHSLAVRVFFFFFLATNSRGISPLLWQPTTGHGHGVTAKNRHADGLTVDVALDGKKRAVSGSDRCAVVCCAYG